MGFSLVGVILKFEQVTLGGFWHFLSCRKWRSQLAYIPKRWSWIYNDIIPMSYSFILYVYLFILFLLFLYNGRFMVEDEIVFEIPPLYSHIVYLFVTCGLLYFFVMSFGEEKQRWNLEKWSRKMLELRKGWRRGKGEEKEEYVKK